MEGYCQHSTVWKDKTRIPMLGGIKIEFQYLKRYGKNFNVLMFGKIKKKTAMLKG